MLLPVMSFDLSIRSRNICSIAEDDDIVLELRMSLWDITFISKTAAHFLGFESALSRAVCVSNSNVPKCQPESQRA